MNLNNVDISKLPADVRKQFRQLQVMHAERKIQNKAKNDFLSFNGEIYNYKELRRKLISRNVKSFHAAINPRLITNKENLIIKLKLAFPELQTEKIKTQINNGKYFYLKKRIDQKDKDKEDVRFLEI